MFSLQGLPNTRIEIFANQDGETMVRAHYVCFRFSYSATTYTVKHIFIRGFALIFACFEAFRMLQLMALTGDTVTSAIFAFNSSAVYAII